MQAVTAKHRVLRRSVTEFNARDSPHADLPPPVNSVVGPIASPLLGGSGKGNGGGNGGGNGDGGENGNAGGGGNGGGNGNGGGGNGGGSSGGGGNNGGGSNGGGSGNSGGGGSGGGGTSGGGGSGGGNTPTLTAPPTSGGGSAPVGPSPTSPNSPPGNLSGSPDGKNSSSGTNAPGPLSSLSGQAGPVNVEPEPSVTTVVPGAASTPTLLTASVSSASQGSLGSGSNTVGVAASTPTNFTVATISSGKHMSGGAIAGITILFLLFLLVLVLLVVRRRSIAHRLELRRKWWFSQGHNFSLGRKSPVGSRGETPTNRLSARSSFATNFDQGLMFGVGSPFRLSLGDVPPLPPMAEVRERNSVLISTGGSVARRESMNSMLSNGSDPGAQYLTVPTGQNNQEPPSPMFVRLFSPSESFAFPKPPVTPSSTASRAPPASSQSSAATLVHLSTPARAFMIDFPPTSALASTSSHLQNSAPSDALSPSADPPMNNPFADPPKPEFADVEVIRHLFTPSLHDELEVLPGDLVRILHIYGDGWAFVEKLVDTGSEHHEGGLIPVDCFRSVDQGLSVFLAEKRIGYGPDQLVATAL